MKSRVIVLALLAVLAALGTVWFLAMYDRVDSREWVGPSGEARLRQFLAAQRLAERMGMMVSEVRSLAELGKLPPDALLIVPSHRQELIAARKAADLVAWVERGGHLIVEADSLGMADPLLDQLGVTRVKAEALRKPFAVTLPDSGRKIRVHITDAMTLDVGRAAVLLDVAGKVVSFERGKGVVTAATGLEFARNPWYYGYAEEQARSASTSIAAHDHAVLLWEVLALTPGDVLQVYFRPERLSLWGFLRQHAAPALIAAGLLLALWLWSIAPRFGPVAPDVPPGRRRLLDHLRASGRFYWTKGLRSRLVVAARDAALRRIARAQPDFASASAAERAARLASILEISREDAHRFIHAGGAMRGADFIRLTQHAQRVHSALEKGKKE